MTAKNNNWIPCTEHLPDNVKLVLCTTRLQIKPGLDGLERRLGFYQKAKNSWHLRISDGARDEEEVIAWQPIDSPWIPPE